jgi:hypothetical protein
MREEGLEGERRPEKSERIGEELTEKRRSLGFGELEQEKRSGEGRIGIPLSPM